MGLGVIFTELNRNIDNNWHTENISILFDNLHTPTKNNNNNKNPSDPISSKLVNLMGLRFINRNK